MSFRSALQPSPVVEVPLVVFTLFPNVDRKQRGLSISGRMYQYNGSVSSSNLRKPSPCKRQTSEDLQKAVLSSPPHQSIMQAVPHIASFLFLCLLSHFVLIYTDHVTAHRLLY